MRQRASYHLGYARSAAESRYPGLWRSLAAAWVPALGPTGSFLPNIARPDWGTFENGLLPSEYSVNEGGMCLNTTYAASNGKRVNFGSPSYINPSTAFDKGVTLSCWFKRTVTSQYSGLLSKGTAFGGNVYSDMDIGISNGNAYWFEICKPGTQFFVSTGSFTSTDVTLWTSTWTGDTATNGVRIYINGNPNPVGTGTCTLSYSDMSDRHSWHLPAKELGNEGFIYFSAIHTRVLTLNEIRQMYEIGPTGMFARRPVYGKAPVVASVIASGANMMMGVSV